LSWSCSDPENDLITYDVYFGDNPPILVSNDQSENLFLVEAVENNTTYFWKIVAFDGFVFVVKKSNHSGTNTKRNNK